MDLRTLPIYTTVDTDFTKSLGYGNAIRLVTEIRQLIDLLKKSLQKWEIFNAFSEVASENIGLLYTALLQYWIDIRLQLPAMQLPTDQIVIQTFSEEFDDFIPQILPEEKTKLNFIDSDNFEIQEIFNTFVYSAEQLLLFNKAEMDEVIKLTSYFARIINYYHQILTDPQAQFIPNIIDNLEDFIFSANIIVLKNRELQLLQDNSAKFIF